MIYNLCKIIAILLLGHILFTYYDVNKETINKIYLIPETYNSIKPIIVEKVNSYVYNIQDDKIYSKDDLITISMKKQNEIIEDHVEYIRKQIIIQAKQGYNSYYWMDKSMVINQNMLNKIMTNLQEQFPNTVIKGSINILSVTITIDWNN